MSRNRWASLLGILILLLFGWGAFHLLNPGPVDAKASAFKEWMWEYRSLDILVQMVLVFAGALGIAAILPIENEDE